MDAKTCTQCGEALAEGADGVCPKCLLKLGLDEAGKDELKPGTLFHGLEIERKLGAGGMGVVYKARQPNLDRSVAVKILSRALSEDPEFTLRFMREARALAALNHPCIIAVYDFGVEDGRYFFVMEYVDGTSLRPLMDRKAVTSQEALKIVPLLCEALEYAHAEGVVHRDIKPENILIDKKGRVKIADFGLAKLVNPGRNETRMTRSDVVMGTPHYMAPEQYENMATVDHRADIYSMGVLFYELLTGDLPIGRFPPPSQRVQVDVRLDEIVLRTLEREPEKRYQSMGEVGRDVTRVTKPASKRAEPEAAESPASQKWHALSIIAIVLAPVLLLVVLERGWPWQPAQDKLAPAEPAKTAQDPSAAAIAKAENLLKQDQPTLALEAAEKQIKEDPENARLRELAVAAAGRHVDHLAAEHGGAVARDWLAAQIREKSYLRPLAVRHAQLDTTLTLQGLFDKGGSTSMKVRDTASDLLRQHAKFPEVPYAAAAVVEKYWVPEAVLWLYREYFARGGSRDDPHPFEICAKIFLANAPDSEDGQYGHAFAREFYPQRRVAWAEGTASDGHGLALVNALAILDEARHPAAKDPVLRALVQALTGVETAAAQKTLLAAPPAQRRRAAEVLERTIKDGNLPEDDLAYLKTLLQSLAP